MKRTALLTFTVPRLALLVALHAAEVSPVVSRVLPPLSMHGLNYYPKDSKASILATSTMKGKR
jgi:hypothetical protein